MAYIGSTPTSQSFTPGTDYFSGNGSTVAFTLTRPAVSINDLIVVIENVVQKPLDAYTVVGTTLTFTSAPPSGTNNIYVRYMSVNTLSVAPNDLSVTTNKIADSSITTAKIADGSITSSKLASGAVTPSQWTTSGSNISYASGNVGIGIATPGTDLQINDTTAMGSGSSTADILTVTNNNAVVNGIANDKLGIVMSAMSDLSDRRVGIYNRAGNVNFNNPDLSIWQTGQGIAYRETLRIRADSATLQFNSGYGSVATAYGCRAWVNFDGRGTPNIRGSGNVSSITDNGTGDNTINFITAMPDANYCVTQACGVKNISWGIHLFAGLSGYGNDDAIAANRFRAITVTPADNTGDTPILCYAVFR